MKRLIWKGIIYNSLENFKLTKQDGFFIFKNNSPFSAVLVI
jgi:hypothetical protein